MPKDSMRDAMLTASPMRPVGSMITFPTWMPIRTGTSGSWPRLLLDLDRTQNSIDRVGEDGQGAIPVVLNDPPGERLVLRLEHPSVLGPRLKAEMLVLLHQGRETNHVREHHRCQLSVQVLTHRDGSQPCGGGWLWLCARGDPR